MIAECVGLGKGIGGNTVVVNPLDIGGVFVGESAVSFHAHINEVGDGLEHGLAVFGGLRGFAVTKINKKRKAGHRNRMVTCPATVGILRRLKPVQAFYHGFFARGCTPFGEQAGHTIRLGTARLHGGGDASEAAAADRAVSFTPTRTEVVAIAEIQGWGVGKLVGNRNRSGGLGIRSDDFCHRRRRRGGFAHHVCRDFFLRHFGFLIEARRIGDDYRGFFDDIGQKENPQYQRDKDDHQNGYHEG